MSAKGFRALFFILVAVAIVYVTAAAQSVGGNVNGTVTDPTGRVVPNATVSALNTATGVRRDVTSNAQGFFLVANLSPGNYQVTITAPGFGRVQQSVVVTVGGSIVTNVQLPVGAVTTEVTVSERPANVELGSSIVSATVQTREIRDLPLNGRDFAQLATLEPGVKTISTQLAAGADTSRINRGFGNQMTISGNRPQLNNYRVDGISINDYSGGSPGSVLGGNLGVDAIQEFSVVTSNATAEYSKTGGGVLNAVTKAGTDAFHGSVYEFLRNSALDARNYFDGPKVPPFRRNQFGAAIGTPIRRNRTFGFADYEGLRQSLTTTNLISVPSPAARRGQLVSGTVTVAPAVAPYLNVFPIPNQNIVGDTGTYAFTGKVVTDENYFTTRVDHTISTKDSMYGTFTLDLSQTDTPDGFNFVEAGLLSNRHLFTIEETHIFSPNLINVARFGFSRSYGSAPISVKAINPLANDPTLSFVPGQFVGSITVPGLTKFTGGVGAIGDYANFFNSFQFYDDVTRTAGTHTLKFGFALERIQHNQLSQGAARNGGYTFGSLKTFLTNAPTNFTAQIPGPVLPIDLRQLTLGAYAQDDWHALRNLTLNLGVRYEMATVPTETANRLATLDTPTSPTPRVGSPYFQNPTLKDVSPRVGFSFDPFKKGSTALRGGIGLYYVLPLTYQFPLLTLNSSPFTQQGQASKLPVGSFPKGGLSLLTPGTARVSYVQQNPAPSYVMQWSLNAQQDLPLHLNMMVGYVGSHGVRQPERSNDIDIVLPIAHTAQGYLWPSPRGSGTRLNPNVGQINGLVWQVSSLYDALFVRVIRNVSHGMRIQGSYTWSKSIDSSSSVASGGQFSNSIIGNSPFLAGAFRGLSDFDVRHNFVFSYLWEIPAPKYQHMLTRAAAGGWQVGTIFQASTGQPFTPIVAGDPLGLLNTQPFDFPDRVRGGSCSTAVNSGNPLHYLNLSCFKPPAQPTLLGNSGRNSVIGPSTSELDVSAYKTVALPIDSFTRLQFRAEAFNVLNHTNFAPPDATASETQVFDQNFNPLPNSGALTYTSTTSRQIQFSLKMIF